MRLFSFIVTTALVGGALSGCICDGPTSVQFVSGINQVYFADSIANIVEPVIQFTYEVEYNSETKSSKKPGCIGYRKDLGISIRTFVLTDSVKVTCNKDLPGTPAGENLEGNPYVEVSKIENDPINEKQLRVYSFASNWTVPSWQSMPDSAELTFHFKLNNGEIITKRNTIVFVK
ncbi:MAG: hypothetical protein EBV15_06080 [Bacteroidetes bacterium]|jgi:hypothetical protein|nr:hypothetical protein [Bacteroidota bacterium]